MKTTWNFIDEPSEIFPIINSILLISKLFFLRVLVVFRSKILSISVENSPYQRISIQIYTQLGVLSLHLVDASSIMEFMSWSMHASESEAWARRKIALFTLINMDSLEHTISTMGRMMMSQNFVCVDEIQWNFLWKMLIYHVARTPTRVRRTLAGIHTSLCEVRSRWLSFEIKFPHCVDPPMQIIWHHFSALQFPISPIVVAGDFLCENRQKNSRSSLCEWWNFSVHFHIYPHSEKKSSSLSVPHLKLILFINHMSWAGRLERVN